MTMIAGTISYLLGSIPFGLIVVLTFRGVFLSRGIEVDVLIHARSLVS